MDIFSTETHQPGAHLSGRLPKGVHARRSETDERAKLWSLDREE